MHESTSQIDIALSGDDLAEVISLPSRDGQSYYQRNTGDLPEIGLRSSDINRRSSLPSPVNIDSNGFMDKIRSLLRVH